VWPGSISERLLPLLLTMPHTGVRRRSKGWLLAGKREVVQQQQQQQLPVHPRGPGPPKSLGHCSDWELNSLLHGFDSRPEGKLSCPSMQLWGRQGLPLLAEGPWGWRPGSITCCCPGHQ